MLLEFLDVVGFLHGHDAGADLAGWDAELRGDGESRGEGVAGAHVHLELVAVAEGGEDGLSRGSDWVRDGEDG